MNKKTENPRGMTQWDFINKNLILFTIFLVVVIGLTIFIGMRCEINKTGHLINCKKCPEPDTIIINLNNNNNFIEIDPSDSCFWLVDQGCDFRFYNAPMGLAIEKHGLMNRRNLKAGVKYEFLIFESDNIIEKQESLNRIMRTKLFLEYLIENDIKQMDNIQLAINRNSGLPYLSFFLFESDRKITSIIYPGPLVNKLGKTYGAFRSTNQTVISNLDDEFAIKWDESEKYSVDSFLNYAKSVALN